jgi:hypothetical protein
MDFTVQTLFHPFNGYDREKPIIDNFGSRGVVNSPRLRPASLAGATHTTTYPNLKGVCGNYENIIQLHLDDPYGSYVGGPYLLSV